MRFIHNLYKCYNQGSETIKYDLHLKYCNLIFCPHSLNLRSYYYR